MTIENLIGAIGVYNEIRIRVEHETTAETIYLKAARTGAENETRSKRMKEASRINNSDVKYICACGNTINITVQMKGEV